MRRGGTLTPLEVVVLIVSDDRAVVEADLAAGALVVLALWWTI